MKTYAAVNSRAAVERARQYAATPRGRFATYTRTAKYRGIAFTLTYAEFLEFWQRPCTYCGTAIETIGLDRVENSLGYLLANVTPCCGTCNRMKRVVSVKEFIDHCWKVAAHMDL